MMNSSGITGFLVHRNSYDHISLIMIIGMILIADLLI